MAAQRPGEVAGRPSLDRPPGERFRAPVEAVAVPARLGRAAGYGAAAALGFGIAWGVLRAVFDIGLGLLAVAAVAGWITGSVVLYGAGSSSDDPRARRVQTLGAAASAAVWLVGMLVAWLVSLAILPGSSLSLPARLASQPFPAWLAPQLSLVDLVAVLLLVSLGWRSAR